MFPDMIDGETMMSSSSFLAAASSSPPLRDAWTPLIVPARTCQPTVSGVVGVMGEGSSLSSFTFQPVPD